MIQLALAFFGLTALYMATGNNARARRWAPLVGLCGQPFWLVFAVQSSAWGLLALSLLLVTFFLSASAVLALYMAWVHQPFI